MGDSIYAGVACVRAVSRTWCSYAARKRPDLKMDDPDAPMLVAAAPGDAALTGLHFLLIHRGAGCGAPGRAAVAGALGLLGTLFMIFVVLTQHPLKALFRGQLPISRRLQALGRAISSTA
jgi:hypothetical protein